MTLTGMQIFKLLPKTNCTICGFPTCFGLCYESGGEPRVAIRFCSELTIDLSWHILHSYFKLATQLF
jgi:CO dehydrogenase/acetyl-CoA synthase gamma subunit (corrinoid Fe-S protein)